MHKKDHKQFTSRLKVYENIRHKTHENKQNIKNLKTCTILVLISLIRQQYLSTKGRSQSGVHCHQLKLTTSNVVCKSYITDLKYTT